MILPYKWNQINKCRRNEGNRKISIKHQDNYCSRQNLQMDAKVNGQNFKDKEYICIVSKHFPQNKY